MQSSFCFTKKYQSSAQVKRIAVLLSAQHIKDKRNEDEQKDWAGVYWFKDEEGVKVSIYLVFEKEWRVQ